MINSCPISPHPRILSSRHKSTLAGNSSDTPRPAATRSVERMSTAGGSQPFGPVVGVDHSFSICMQLLRQFWIRGRRCEKSTARDGGHSLIGLKNGESMRRRPAREKETGTMDLEISLAMTTERIPPRDHPIRNQYLSASCIITK